LKDLLHSSIVLDVLSAQASLVISKITGNGLGGDFARPAKVGTVERILVSGADTVGLSAFVEDRHNGTRADEAGVCQLLSQLIKPFYGIAQFHKKMVDLYLQR
jgi:hypothetical protein